MEAKPKHRAARTPLLAPLTTFRFFAALAIVVFHSARLHNAGYLASGVSFFFVLSGFVLTYVHPHLDAPGSPARFWIARFSRIWPLHCFTFLLVVLFQPFGWLANKHFGFEAFANLALLQCWIPVGRVCQSFNFVSWSLSVEAFFYACFPWLLPRVFRWPVLSICGAVLLNIVLATGAAMAGLPDQASASVPSYQAFLYCPALHLFEFVLGMAVAVWWMNASRSGGPSSLHWLEWVVFFGALLAIPWLDPLARTLTMGNTRYEVDHQLANFLRAPVFAALIYVFAFQKGLLARVFSHAWLVYLGEISFSVYMIHCIVLELYRRLHGPMPPSFVGTMIYYALVIAGAALLYGLLERPARKGVAAFLERRLGLEHAARG